MAMMRHTLTASSRWFFGGWMLAAACVAGLITPEAAHAQGRANSRNSLAVRAAFRDVIEDARMSVVRVRTEGQTVAFGAIVDANGYVLTKASELSGPLTCKLSDNREVEASLIGVREDYDLAMLKIEADNLRPVEWIGDDDENIAGTWVVTPALEVDPLAVGVVSVGSRQIRRVSGVLGITMEEAEGGAKIVEVTDNSGAEKAGLQVDDVITFVNRERVMAGEEVTSLLSELSVGDIIRLRVRRGDDISTIDAKLGERPRRGPGRRGRAGRGRPNFQNTMGGDLSDRAAGFPAAIQHDTILQPNECGGPLLNLDGRAVGINIARAGRVMSYAIPAEEIRPLLEDLKSGVYSPFIDYDEGSGDDSDDG